MIYSFIIDLTWILFWNQKWSYIIENHEKNIQGFVMFFSWVGLLVKFVTIFSVGIIEWNNLLVSLPSKLKEKLSSSGMYQEQKDEPSNI